MGRVYRIFLAELGGVPDTVKVLDFGLVKQLESAPDSEQTHSNALLGTPHYIPPEAITHPDATDGRSDLYSLAAVGYFLLTGTPVFPGRSVIEICSRHLYELPEAPSQRLGQPIPESLEQLLLQCLSKDPSDRPPSVMAFRQALQKLPEVQGWTPETATHWWRQHDEAVCRAPSGATQRLGTLSVDLARRR